jgi:hypothetical protein
MQIEIMISFLTVVVPQLVQNALRIQEFLVAVRVCSTYLSIICHNVVKIIAKSAFSRIKMITNAKNVPFYIN